MGSSRDKILLTAALVLLAIGAFTLGLLFPGREALKRARSGLSVGKEIASLDKSGLAATLDGWNRTPSWQMTSGEGDLFMAEKYMMYPNGEVTPVDANTMIDNLPLSWLLQNNVDFRSANVGNEDPDGDGFSNRQEFQAHTNPRDAKSHPPYVTRLRVRVVDSVSFKVLFQNYNKLQGAYVFSLNLPNAASKQNRLVRRGENVEGFVVSEFRQREEGDGDDSPDHSELDFSKPNSDIKITAVLNKMVESATTFVRFTLLLPGQMDRDIRVEVNKTFELPPEPGVKYLLVSAEPGSATIRNVSSGQEMTVAKWTAEEEKDISQIHGPGRRGSQ
jgi:hypothetical protein